MKVLTVVSDKNNIGFFRLKATCAMQGLDLIAIICHQATFVNNRVKDDLLKRYLLEFDDEEIIMFSDGYDTLLLAGQEEILEKFYRSESDLLVSAEANCFPEKSLAGRYPACDTIYRYLNCGGFIGKVAAIKEFLFRDLADPGSGHAWSNQYIWTQKYLQDTRKIKLDTRCEIFCTFYTVITQFPTPEDAMNNREAYSSIYCEWFYHNFIIRDGRIFNRLTGTWPCNAHFNGVSSLFLDDSMVGLDLLYSQIAGRSNAVLRQVCEWSHPANVH
jgi:hypothetical protein